MEPCCRNFEMNATQIIRLVRLLDSGHKDSCHTATCPIDPAGGGRLCNSSLLCCECSLADPEPW